MEEPLFNISSEELSSALDSCIAAVESCLGSDFPHTGLILLTSAQCVESFGQEPCTSLTFTMLHEYIHPGLSKADGALSMVTELSFPDSRLSIVIRIY
jgi:hypothetical protein